MASSLMGRACGRSSLTGFRRATAARAATIAAGHLSSWAAPAASRPLICFAKLLSAKLPDRNRPPLRSFCALKRPLLRNLPPLPRTRPPPTRLPDCVPAALSPAPGGCRGSRGWRRCLSCRCRGLRCAHQSPMPDCSKRRIANHNSAQTMSHEIQCTVW
jgi:hypothetical protein